ncbi:hypothetical protein QJS04_geneDACA020473 [Acorus gramineus]|uniref:Pectinesterase inhibitor domain-containing protein n=1 Tax=Acorus gramineus TaxID=55184 RepID=A0AAV9AB32_ACOGR|nr:hypothetical protein QJS04_geneDACA020473 [Acorus gramineus]
MEVQTVFSALLLVLLSSTAAARPGPLLAPKEATMNFIRASCSSTEYPNLCFQSLSVYANKIQTNPVQLAHTALSISLNSTAKASASISTLSRRPMRPREAAAMRDCVETFGDAVEELRGSLAEMGRLRGPDFGFRLSNIQTWVSAAITDQSTCMDGFDEGGAAAKGAVKEAVRREVVRVSQLTSNALGLINSLVSTAP